MPSGTALTTSISTDFAKRGERRINAWNFAEQETIALRGRLLRPDAACGLWRGRKREQYACPDTRTNSGTRTNSDAYTYTYADTHADSDAYAYAYANTDSNADSDAYAYADTHADSDAHTDPYTDADPVSAALHTGSRAIRHGRIPQQRRPRVP